MTVLRPLAGNRGAPTMQSVADRAGVSIASVSNVLNHPEKVSVKTTAIVRSAIEELGFVRNDAGRTLATGSSKSLGLVVADIENSLFMDMAHGAQQAARSAGLSVLIGNAACDIGQQNDYLDLFDESRVGGVLLAPMEDSWEGVQRVRAHGRQIVLLNYSPPNDDCCAVLVDNEAVGYLAARHLIERGRTRLAFLTSRDPYQPIRERRSGVQRAIAEAHGAVQFEEIDTGGLADEHGFASAASVLRREVDARPDAIVAVTDAIAYGFIRCINASRVATVPEDIAVVGCENNRTSVSGTTPLTVLDLPGRLIGLEATALLLEEASAAPGEHAHRTVVFQPALVERASTASGVISVRSPAGPAA